MDKKNQKDLLRVIRLQVIRQCNQSFFDQFISQAQFNDCKFITSLFGSMLNLTYSAQLLAVGSKVLFVAVVSASPLVLVPTPTVRIRPIFAWFSRATASTSLESKQFVLLPNRIIHHCNECSKTYHIVHTIPCNW